ncbi:MAG TPA: amino acid adenylation domain-containing protein, partial [Ktedonobacteraceae bacterium]
LAEGPQGVLGTLEYDRDLFEPATVQRWSRQYVQVLQGMTEQPERPISQLSLLSEAERQLLLVAWNATHREYPRQICLHELFEAQVRRTPEAIAAADDQGQLSYQELNSQANQLARYLQKRGVGPAVIVGLCIERSLPMLVGILGILKAGGVYLPLDPTYPQERLAFMLSNAQAGLEAGHGVPVLTRQHLLEVLPAKHEPIIMLDLQWPEIAAEAGENLARTVESEDLAYVIYTSGSTGRPKGVLGTHRATINRLHWMWERFPFAEAEISCQKTSLSFLDSAWEIFGSLLRGVRMTILADEIVKDPYRLISVLAEQGVTRLVVVPSLLETMLNTRLDLETSLARVKYWTSSGEALPVELAQRFLSQLPRSILLNLYGSSEVAADATYAIVAESNALTHISPGSPIANTQIYLLDARWQPVPLGMPGELYVGGAGVARGSLQRPDLTAERFIPDPFGSEPGARLYRTGDRARYLEDGTLEYLGRFDEQVKVRGYRVELGEIEAALRAAPGVHEAVVILRAGPPGDNRLVGYVLPTAGQNPPLLLGQLRALLRSQLPGYMQPSALLLVEGWPLTPNGKLDRRALPAPAASRPHLETRYQPPRTPLEELVAALWSEVLRVEQIGVHDDFFALGGHSLLATQVIARARSLFQLELPLRSL